MAKRLYRPTVSSADYIPRVNGLLDENESQHQLQPRGDDGRFIENDIAMATFNNDELLDDVPHGFHLIDADSDLYDGLVGNDDIEYKEVDDGNGYAIFDADGHMVDLDHFDDQFAESDINPSDEENEAGDDVLDLEKQVEGLYTTKDKHHARRCELGLGDRYMDRWEQSHGRGISEYQHRVLEMRGKGKCLPSTPPNNNRLAIQQARKDAMASRYYGTSDDPWRFYEETPRPKAKVNDKFTIWTALRLWNKTQEKNQPTKGHDGDSYSPFAEFGKRKPLPTWFHQAVAQAIQTQLSAAAH